MSVFHDKFEAECKYSEEIGAYHIRVNGELLTHDDKAELEKMFERALVGDIEGWIVNYDGLNSRLMAMPIGTKGDRELLTFVKAKAELIAFLRKIAADYRMASQAVAATRKLDTLAGSL